MIYNDLFAFDFKKAFCPVSCFVQGSSGRRESGSARCSQEGESTPKRKSNRYSIYKYYCCYMLTKEYFVRLLLNNLFDIWKMLIGLRATITCQEKE